MIRWAILDGAGCVASGGTSPVLPEGAVALPTGMTLAQAAGMMFGGGAWAPRPAVPDPVLTAGDNATEVAWTGLPAGAVLTVTDGETGETLASVAEGGGAIEVSLVDPGPYILDLALPPPFLPQTLAVTR